MIQDISVIHYPRYNVTSALAALLFVAVGLAALREADELWYGWLFYPTFVLLLVAVLLAALRTGDRRAFWIGFAVFGWGYLSLSLIPSTEPRLITTKILLNLYKSTLLRTYLYRIRVIADLDRMRAYSLSLDDLLKAMEETRMLGTPEQEQFRRDLRTLEYVRGSYVLGFVNQRYYRPEQWESFILKATAEGEILRLKDVAKVEMGTPFYAPRWAFAPPGAGTAENFFHIGHTLFSLQSAFLGGVLSRWLRRVAILPEVFAGGE
jgi:hypothetical protein